MKNPSLAHATFAIAAVISQIFLLPPPSALANSSSALFPDSAITAAKYNAASTTVAILPVINITKSKHSDKDIASQAEQSQHGNQALADDFLRHNFQVTDPALIATAMKAGHLDPVDLASWTADNLAGIGTVVHADLVVLMVITDTHKGYRHGILLFGSQMEGEAKTKLWLVDTRTHKAIIDGFPAAGKAQESALKGWVLGPIGENMVGYVRRAIDDATNKSLEGFMKPYLVAGKTPARCRDHERTSAFPCSAGRPIAASAPARTNGFPHRYGSGARSCPAA